MRIGIKGALLGAISVFLAFIVIRGCTAHNSKPRLTMTFIGATNVVGQNIAKFSITNTGNAVATLSLSCSVEVQEPPSKVHTACRASVKELAPGQGATIDVFLPQTFTGGTANNSIDVFLPPSFPGKWRVKCFCAQTGLRSKSYAFMWNGNGVILRKYIPVKWIPRYFKQLPLDVTATSDWIAP